MVRALLYGRSGPCSHISSDVRTRVLYLDLDDSSNGGEEGLRSLYLLLARQVLYPLSYFPIIGVYTAISIPRRSLFYDRLLDVKPFAIKLRRGLRRIQRFIYFIRRESCTRGSDG